MLLVSHLGRHSMVHSHGFNIDDPVSSLKNTRIRPFYVCSRPCSTSTAPNVPVVGGTFRLEYAESGDPQSDFFHSRHEDARSTSLEFQFLRARSSSRNFLGVKLSKTQRMDSATL